MTASPIMVQGTGSYVGKSVLTAALCRYFFKEGYRVAPFKSQNMSNNSFVTAGGGEIGRAQAFQAAACGIEPSVEMNPILLKPSSEMGSQLVVLGKPVAHMHARQYHEYQKNLKAVVHASLEHLADSYDVVVIEGAGSPAEINLREFDIANMFVAKMAKAPVLLLGDIHAGGVFASLLGTLELLEPDERALVKAFVINKFRGDRSLLTGGLSFLTEKTGKRNLGVIPFISDLRVAEEDGRKVALPSATEPVPQEKLNIYIVEFPRISNSTDFECFAHEPDVALKYLSEVPHFTDPLPDAIILPGTKSTMADLEFVRSSGLEGYLRRLRTQNIPIVGICGGFQVLGKRIVDVERIEGNSPSAEGLGFLEVVTTFDIRKKTVRVQGVSLASGQKISGYEIHMGKSEPGLGARPFLRITQEQDCSVDRTDGCISADGLIWGTYVHGVFDAAGFRREFLNQLRARRRWKPLAEQSVVTQDAALDSLADIVYKYLDRVLLAAILDRKR